MNNPRQDKKSVKHAEDILDEYDQISPDELHQLAETNTPESRERLAQLAEKYDIPLASSISIKELVDRIINAMVEQDAPNQYLGTE